MNWISIKDQMPPNGKLILIATDRSFLPDIEGGYPIKYTAYHLAIHEDEKGSGWGWEIDQKEYRDMDTWLHAHEKDITHWCEISDPLK